MIAQALFVFLQRMFWRAISWAKILSGDLILLLRERFFCLMSSARTPLEKHYRLGLGSRETL